MTIDKKPVDALLLGPDPLLGTGIKCVLDKKAYATDAQLEHAIAEAIQEAGVGPRRVAQNPTYFINIPRLEAALRLPRSHGTLHLNDYTSALRGHFGGAKSWLHAAQRICEEVANTFARFPTVHTVGFFVDSTHRNSQRGFTAAERSKAMDEATRERVKRNFDFGATDHSALMAEIERHMDPLTPAQQDMLYFFSKPDTALADLIREAEKIAPYIATSANNWFSDSRVRQ